MKIIHTADIHLDSPLIGVKDSSVRRSELLRALKRLADYADNVNAEAVIVSGDLFDDKFVKRQTVQSVADIINGSRSRWFILRGNHADESPYKELSLLCPTVGFFGDSWTVYNIDNVAIYGRELGQNDKEQWAELACDKNNFNIVVIHGDLDDVVYGFIDKKALAACGADYVALGHRHSFAAHKFGTVNGCYSGALEPRGFDESAPTGFVEIDTESRKITFVKQSVRRIENVELDVSGIKSDVELENRLSDALADVNTQNYLNLKLKGSLHGGVRAEYVAKQTLSDRYFALRVQDDTTAEYDVSALKQEISLRGEFVKLALNIEDEKERKAVLKMGLSVIGGEEVV